MKKRIIFIITIIFFMLMLFFLNKTYAAEKKTLITSKTDEKITGYTKVLLSEIDEVFTSENFLKNLMQSSNNEIITKEYVDHYYYNQLTNDIGKMVYNSLNNDKTGKGDLNINFTNQEYTIKGNNVGNTEYLESVHKEKIWPYIYDAILAFNNDNPQIYWYYNPELYIYFTTYSKENKIVYENMTINTNEILISEKNNYQNFNMKVDDVVNSINELSIQDTIIACHDYICNSVLYTKNDVIDQTAYDALMNQKGVCAAQARLFQLLCRRKNILCILVTGYSMQGESAARHAWNYVYHPDEKKWYAVDVTWDNRKVKGLTPWYKFFMVGKTTDVPDNTTFSENHLPGNTKAYDLQSFIPVLPELSDESYVRFSGKAEKSTKEKTKDSVIITVEFSREIQESDDISDWSISEDKKSMTKTFNENTEQKIIIYSIRGEKLIYNLKVENIDKIAPNCQIFYSTKDKTNQGVQVKIISDEEIKEADGWELSEDKKELTKTYFENTMENVEIQDIAGNVTTKTVVVDNIDTNIPQVNVIYSTKEITNQNVMVNITSDEEIKEVDGWELSTDKKTLTKIYNRNITEEVIITDLYGNTTTKNIIINNIDKEKPIIEVKYNNLENHNVEVNIESNELLRVKDGWELSEDKKILRKTYIENTEENIEVEDLAGNKTIVKIIITNINYQDGKYQVTYSTREKTNEDVTVTITSNKQLKNIEKWELSEDKKILRKTYIENTEEDIEVEDIDGNKVTIKISIENIDKINPETTIQYSTQELTNKDVQVIVEANEEIKQINGWEISKNKKVLTRTYDKNTEENIEVEDIAGNKTTIPILIKNIDKEKLEYDISYSETAKTNKDILVTIVSNKELYEVQGWQISQNRKSITKKYSENIKESIILKSINGFEEIVTVSISNIDKILPEIEVVYSEPDSKGNITVTLISNKELREKDGWELSEDRKRLNKQFSTEIEDEVQVFDLAGNEKKVRIKIENKTEDKTENKPEDKTEDKTENKPEDKTEDKTENKPEDKTEDKTENKTEDKTEDKTENKTDDKTEDNNIQNNKEEKNNNGKTINNNQSTQSEVIELERTSNQKNGLKDTTISNASTIPNAGKFQIVIMIVLIIIISLVFRKKYKNIDK